MDAPSSSFQKLPPLGKQHVQLKVCLGHKSGRTPASQVPLWGRSQSHLVNFGPTSQLFSALAYSYLAYRPAHVFLSPIGDKGGCHTCDSLKQLCDTLQVSQGNFRSWLCYFDAVILQKADITSLVKQTSTLELSQGLQLP